MLDDIHTGLSLPKDLPAVEELAAQEDVALLLLDPLMSRIDEKLDTHRDAETRRALEPIAGLAHRANLAVLGLIHVMRGLGGTSGLGSGIAVAFVATVYGVGTANLLLLPLAGRLRERAALAAQRRDLMLAGICAIQERTHPRVLARKLRSFGVKPELERVTQRTSSAAGDMGPGMMTLPLGTAVGPVRDQALA